MLQAEGAPHTQAQSRRRRLVRRGKSREAERQVPASSEEQGCAGPGRGVGLAGREGGVIARFSAEEQHGLSYL